MIRPLFLQTSSPFSSLFLLSEVIKLLYTRVREGHECSSLITRYLFMAICFVWSQLVLDAAPLTRVDSMEMLRDSTTPGRGIERRGSLFRTNSIIDGNELEVFIVKKILGRDR